ncbi:MAG TPA: DUF3224 domain-containing protein [Gemmatimonadota bacterium]|nr:DUF3224 domain-containing protein [Gemmatimonadota bacterium]
MQASGTFDVELTPQPSDGGATPGRMTIAKRFHGDLEGTSQGQMLTAMTAVDGSAAYVAIEEFRGTLHGKSGTFALQHSGTMARGAAGASPRRRAAALDPRCALIPGVRLRGDAQDELPAMLTFPRVLPAARGVFAE